MTFGLKLASAIGACLGVSSAAFAGESECDVVVKAMLAVNDQPSVRQTMMTKDNAEPLMASILLKDAMYIQQGAAQPWRKLAMGAPMRRKLAEHALVSLPISDCATGAQETVNGAAASAYSFSQPNPLKPGEKAASTILIGFADGLPIHMDLTDGSQMLFEYGDFQPPVP